MLCVSHPFFHLSIAKPFEVETIIIPILQLRKLRLDNITSGHSTRTGTWEVWPGACALDLCALLLLSKEKLPRTSFEKRSLEGNRSPVFHTWYFDGECMIVPAAHLSSYHFPSSRWDPALASFLLTCVVWWDHREGENFHSAHLWRLWTTDRGCKLNSGDLVNCQAKP